MKDTHRRSWKWLGRKLRIPLLTGILVTVPLGVTIWVLIWIFTAIDNILQPILQLIWERPVPGIGFGITIVLIYLVGVIASNIIGKRLITFGESLLAKVPVVRPLYAGVKQLIESFSAPGESGLMEVVLLEFPRKELWSIGFITNQSQTDSGETLFSIFVPGSPNPTSGFLQMVKEDEFIRTNITREEALKMVMSAGRVSPREIITRLSEKTNE